MFMALARAGQLSTGVTMAVAGWAIFRFRVRLARGGLADREKLRRTFRLKSRGAIEREDREDDAVHVTALVGLIMVAGGVALLFVGVR